MTDGTSQGLFIVVAIVIFGIFTVMAYILFEDTLSPAMANMFSTASEQATNKLSSNSTHIKGTDTRFLDLASPGLSDMKRSANKVSFSNPGIAFTNAAYIPNSFFEADKDYILTYDIKKTNGDVRSLGGHIYISTNSKLFVNGVEIGGYHSGGAIELEDNITYSVRVEFKTDRFVRYDDYNYGVNIQPNRHYNLHVNGNPEVNFSHVPYSVEIKNIKLSESN